MKVRQLRQPDGTIQLTANATAAELRDSLDYAYHAFAQSIGLGPNPEQTIEEAAAATLGITDLSPLIHPYLVERLVSLAIDKSGIMPAYIPKTANLSSPQSGKGITLEFEVTPKPELELSSYDPVSISVVKPVIFEEDIEHEMASYESLMESFDDPDKNDKLRELVVQKLEYQQAESFLNQQRQAASIELAKRLEGTIPDDIIRSMFLELLDSLKDQLRSQGTSFQDFLEEHGGEENVNMLLMWQARESLSQGYALDALFRYEKLKVTESDIDITSCIISGLDNPKQARENARSMGRMHSVKEAAQRFKATDWLLERAEITVRERSPFES